MVRASIWSLIALAIVPVGIAQADDAKKSDGKHHMQATITKVDSQKDMISVKVMDKNGKEQEKTLHLAKDAKYLNSAGKDAKLDSFKTGDDVCVTEKDDKVTELKKHAEAKITKVDKKTGDITVKMTDKDGKEIEKTFRLVEETDYADSTGRIAELDIFQSGDDILFVEADGKITAMKKADAKGQAKTAKAENEKKSAAK
jgi:hypothetical protein